MNNEEKILAMLESLTDKVDQLQETQEQMQTTLTRVALTQENTVLKSLDALAEGQDLTHQRLKDLAGKDELAELREEVRLLRSVKDKKLAWEKYMAYTRQGGSRTFTDLLKNAELDSPFDEKCLRGVCEAAGEWLDKFDLTDIM